jgi:hypothetical protein
MSSGSSVGIATGYGLDYLGVGVRVQAGSRIFRPAEAQPASYPMNSGDLSQGVKRSELKASHSPETSVELKITFHTSS